ncbi:putative endonuclease [Nonlabens xylanidelens]|uniref:Putative endonuclease n=1 Tax=Nonlabens xylanidelens TaxID=191564 RepID=A0A2S6IL18_9FLAO|nr:GIY-YIG nuclease family protein [Nonlabens xylanidelens]PPK94934.1 putative endonuclease [Nonlabens xylanidelens]PQJ17481.1 hypothetical protein BST94_10505 [Nonlabens xylanidelens]
MNYQFYVYLLECNDRLLYTGMTNNIQRRFNEHQKGLNPRSFTFKRRPVELLFHEQFNDVFQAYHFEARIKKGSAKKKRALASGDFDRLKILSNCQNDSSSAFASSDDVPKRER